MSAGIGMAIGGASDSLSTLMNYMFSKKLMERQYQYNLKTLRNAPSASREGFTTAGYNPLLALGSGQAGFSASSSGLGTDLASGIEAGVNSALAYKENKATLKKLDAETKGIEETTKGVELDNKLKEKELNTSPKSIFSDFVEDRPNPVVNKFLEIGENLGWFDSNKSKPNSAQSAKEIKLHNDKPYVQRGVPRSVVKSLNNVNSAVGAKRIDLSDRKPYSKGVPRSVVKSFDNKSKNYYNRPPKDFPR